MLRCHTTHSKTSFILEFSTDEDGSLCGECDHSNEFCHEYESRMKCSNAYVIKSSDYGNKGGQFI